MKKNFLDANIVVGLLDSWAEDHQAAVGCMRIVRKHFGKPFVSPFTFVIANFLFGKLVKNKQWHNRFIPPLYDLCFQPILQILKMPFSINVPCHKNKCYTYQRFE